jgi:3-dehydroquinate synthase
MNLRETRVNLGSRGYPIRFGSDLSVLLQSLPERVRAERAFGFVDETVAALHGERLEQAIGSAGLNISMETVPSGETSKNINTFLSLCRYALRHGLDRESVVFAIGGGVVGDLSGFVAASALRGIRWVICPTTVLAMVDASIGGKTGINLDGAKNNLGAFHQPEAVLADVGFLATLPPREHRAGLAEVLKAAVIRDADLFEVIEAIPDRLLGGSSLELMDVMNRAAAVKARVVEADEREAGQRAILNFGHTIAHALESATGFARWRHGEAVAIGMACAATLSVDHLGCPRDDLERLLSCLQALGLPIEDPDTDASDLLPWLCMDKKVSEGEPRFVLTPRIGSASFGHRISQPIVKRTLARFFGGSVS